MKNRKIYITEPDMQKLQALIEGVRAGGVKHKENIENLEQELDKAILVDPKKVPADVVTMNSTVCVMDVTSGEESTYTVVFPADASVADHKISILAPIGTALLGYKVGDVVDWEMPYGLKRIKIMKTLYQPEASGDYHL